MFECIDDFNVNRVSRVTFPDEIESFPMRLHNVITSSRRMQSSLTRSKKAHLDYLENQSHRSPAGERMKARANISNQRP